jgi:hypothetical protein
MSMRCEHNRGEWHSTTPALKFSPYSVPPLLNMGIGHVVEPQPWHQMSGATRTDCGVASPHRLSLALTSVSMGSQLISSNGWPMICAKSLGRKTWSPAARGLCEGRWPRVEKPMRRRLFADVAYVVCPIPRFQRRQRCIGMSIR